MGPSVNYGVVSNFDLNNLDRIAKKTQTNKEKNTTWNKHAKQ